MNLTKISGLLGLAIAAVGAFVTIPYAALLLLITGLVSGAGVAREDTVRVLATALVLSLVVTHSFDSVPAVGSYLSAFVAGVAAFVAGASLSLMGRNIYARFKP
jgi:hypothetical protein